MKWFKHMSDLPRDEGVARYLDAAGRDHVTAYGFLTLLLEAIATRMDWREGDHICSATYSIAHWGRITYSHPNRVTKYLRLCEVIGWVLVEFEGSSCTVTIPRMVQWRDEYTRKSGHTQDKVAQSREEQSRTDKKESRDDDSLSDGSARREASRTAPHDFKITPKSRQWAITKFPEVDIDKETEKFRLYEFPMPKSDWDAAWRNWIIRADEYSEKDKNNKGSESSLSELAKKYGLSQVEDETEEHFRKRVSDASIMAEYRYSTDQFRQ